MGLLADYLPDFLPSDPNQNQAARQGLLQFGAALLGGRGNFGSILGQGIQAGAGGYNSALQALQQKALMDAQTQHLGLENQAAQAQLDAPAKIASILNGGDAPPAAPSPAASLVTDAQPAPLSSLPQVTPSADAKPLSMIPQASSPGQFVTPPVAPASPAPAAQPAQADLFTQYMGMGDKLSKAGYPAQAKNYYDLAQKLKPEVQEVKTAIDPTTGQPVQVITFKDGSQKTSSYGALPDNQVVDLGGSQVLVDKNTGKQGPSFTKTATPGEIMQDATARRGQNMVDARAKAGQDGPGDTQFMRELAAMYPKGSPEYDEALRQRINKEAGINAGGGGGRSVVYNGRIIASGNEVAQALRNITELPVTSNAGFMGMGGAQSANLLSAGMAGLKNDLNPDQIKTYNTMWTGVSRNLGTLETSGLATTGDLIKSIDKLQFVPGDNGYNALRKLAEVRQITEAALEPKLHDPAVPGQQREYIQGVINAVHAAVPYTHADLTAYDRAAQKNPALTFQQFAAQTVNKGKPVAPVAALPQNPPAVPSDIAALLGKYGRN